MRVAIAQKNPVLLNRDETLKVVCAAIEEAADGGASLVAFGETFAPGFFIWNSEVGRRSLGIQTFWFEALCANHVVWDAVEVVLPGDTQTDHAETPAHDSLEDEEPDEGENHEGGAR